jgi:hypothetical protein
MAFMKKIQTKQITATSHSFIYAQGLHDNAEKAGYRCYLLGICALSRWRGSRMKRFQYKNKGIVFLDCTDGSNGRSWNYFVNVEIEKQYIPKDAFHGCLMCDLK